jgi:Zn-finger nucleic acid-binding protein
MKCPRDSQDLSVQDSEGQTGYVCAACDGRWLPLRYIESIKYWRTWFSDTEFAKRLHEATQRQTTLQCPAKCGSLSAAFFHSIEVDWCQRCHGVWFDKGEFRKTLEINRPKEQSSVWEGADILTPLIDAILSGFSP